MPEQVSAERKPSPAKPETRRTESPGPSVRHSRERRGSMIKNSVGIWAFGPAVTRFVPPGYHNEVANEPMVAKTERVAGGLHDLLEGLEYHYPGEINEDNAEEVLRVLAAHGMDLPVIAAGLHPDPTYALGAFINPDEGLRRRGIDTLRRGIDLCAQVGANFIIWPGAEGYNYTFQRPYAEIWRRFVEGVAELTDHANEKGVKVFLEHKNSEPAMKILMQNIGMTLFTIQKVNTLGVDTTNLQVNMDWQHLIMNGENLAEYADLLASEHKLGHQHGNDGWGTFDDDNVVGTNFFMQTLELAQTLQDTGYGEEGKLNADALAGQKAVYAALGLDADYEAEIIKRRKEAKTAGSETKT